MQKKTLFVNGVERRTVSDPECSLLSFLRRQMLLAGVKEGHGACTVIVDGEAVKACAVKMKDVPADARITTIEGLGSPENLHPLQTSWILHQAASCGTCTPGFILSAQALLGKNASPAKEEILAWFTENGNICQHICPDKAANAVLDAARLLNGTATIEELWLKQRDEVFTPAALLADTAALDMVTGAYAAVTDLGLKLPEGALFAKLVQPAQSRAEIFSVDASQAEKAPGVFKVITAKEVAGSNRVGAAGKILCDRAVSGANDAVAAVLGFTPAAAAEAAELVKVVLEADNDAPPAQCCCCAEPAVAFAYVNDKGKLIIHSQRDDLNISALEDGLGIDHGKLGIVNIPGAVFSGQLPSTPLEGIAGAAALAAGKPVYLQL